MNFQEMIEIKSCNIWITLENDNPDFEDFAKVRHELENLGIHYQDKLGIALTKNQWVNLLSNLSRFEHRFIDNNYVTPNMLMGFPVRIIANEKE